MAAGYRPGMLLSTLECQGRFPVTRDDRFPNVNR